MTRLAGLIVVLATFSLSASAQTPNQFGLQFGLDLDSNEFYLGPNGVFELPFQVGDNNILLNPEFSYWFEDDDFEGASNSFWLITVNGLYPLAVEFADAYVGAGLAISHWSLSYDTGNEFNFFQKRQTVSSEVSESSTDLGVNFKAGATIGSGSIKPNAEVGFVLSDSSWPYVQIGARYTP